MSRGQIETTFTDGPLAGVRPMNWAPEYLELHHHRTTGELILDETGGVPRAKWDRQNSPDWERLHYRQVSFYSASEPLRSSYVFAGPLPDCLLDGEPYTPVDNCFDHRHKHFWLSTNWPGGRAPGRWFGPPEHDWIGVELNMPTSDGYDEDFGCTHFGSAIAAQGAVKSVRDWIRIEAECLPGREEAIVERNELAEMQSLPGALPG